VLGETSPSYKGGTVDLLFGFGVVLWFSRVSGMKGCFLLGLR
jgi:hypothetical protein